MGSPRGGRGGDCTFAFAAKTAPLRDEKPVLVTYMSHFFVSFQTVIGDTHPKIETTLVFSPVEVTLAIALVCGNAVCGGLSAKRGKSFPAY